MEKKTPERMILERSSPLNDPDQYHDDSDHQQNMDESADDIAADHSEQPQNQKNDSNSPQHIGLRSDVRSDSWIRVCSHSCSCLKGAISLVTHLFLKT